MKTEKQLQKVSLLPTTAFNDDYHQSRVKSETTREAKDCNRVEWKRQKKIA